MLNIEKYKDEIIKADMASITCSVNNCVLGLHCFSTCRECKKNVMNWLLEECEESVLDDAEKGYLSAVIRPFRKEVDTISKFRTWEDSLQNICISMKDNRICTLPVFPKGTMYKGMEEGRNYSLKELGL